MFLHVLYNFPQYVVCVSEASLEAPGSVLISVAGGIVFFYELFPQS